MAIDPAYLIGFAEKVGATDGYGFVFSPVTVRAQGEKTGEGGALSSTLAYLIAQDGSVVILVFDPSYAGPAVREMLIGPSLDDGD